MKPLYDSLTITDWVTQAQSGSAAERRAALNALVLHFWPYALRLARARLHDPFLAEDVAQEALIHATSLIHQVRQPQAFSAWLRRIVLSQCARQQRRPAVYEDALDDVDATWEEAWASQIESQPEEAYQVHERIERVRQAIAALPEHERAVTEGFYLQGESQRELAERLHLPLDTVKKRLQYARQRLRGFLAELNDAVDRAFADMLSPTPPPARQPVYLYRRPDDER
ncbi:MAG: sigma-70 family RNA polymerase sigma factor [Anaerolineae bacterium]|nr:sigma-70 family RNA polymerase sigma factor [Anaerolineae bacterium]MDW8173431.1 sigma-70 family RNA polymerase sigma factor [Anaerolineae bacterium]